MPSKDQLITSLLSLNGRVTRRIDAKLSPHGISLTEFLVLSHLSAAPAQSLRRVDLAEQVGMSASGVTRLLLPMEKNRLVKKGESARDARVRLVILTKSGERIYRESAISYEHGVADLLDALTQRQIDDMGRCIAAIRV